jgi:hypothetical protein
MLDFLNDILMKKIHLTVQYHQPFEQARYQLWFQRLR